MKVTFRRFRYADFHIGFAFKKKEWIRIAFGWWLLLLEKR